MLTSNAKCFLPFLLSKLTLQLEAEPLVKRRPLSSLRINASDQVEFEGGDSMTHLFTYVIVNESTSITVQLNLLISIICWPN